MGYLTKITKEYFGEDTRKEEGKYIEVKGYKVLVPGDFDEDRFLECVEEILIEGEGEFVHSNYKTRHFLHIPCGNDYVLELNPVSEFRENLTHELTDRQMESAIGFLGHLLEDIDMDNDNYGEYIVLMSESDMFNRLECEIYDSGINEIESQICYETLLDWFIEDFKKETFITKDDLHTIQYYHCSLNLRVTYKDNGRIMFLPILYAKEMVKWWQDTLDDIERTGAREYFGIEDEEEEE